jgi:hypothetical protein
MVVFHMSWLPGGSDFVRFKILQKVQKIILLDLHHQEREEEKSSFIILTMHVKSQKDVSNK